MPYRIVEVEVTDPAPTLHLGVDETGVALISRRHGRVVGFALHAVEPRTVLEPAAVTALLDPEPTTESNESVDGLREREGQSPSITVAICTRDRPELLQECLQSMLRLRPQPHEVVVVDNAPSDAATQRLVQGMAVRYICEPIPGLDFARNRALRESTGDFVAFIDDDTVVDSFWLEGLQHALRRDPDAAAVTGQVLPFELETPAQVAFEQRGGFRRLNETIRWSGPVHRGRPLYPYGAGEFGAGCNMAFRRSAAVALGGFDEALDTGPPLPGGGDLDMLHRVVRSGRTLVYEPRAVLFHRHRRTPEGLRRQYESWGRAFMAYVSKTYRDDPAGRRQLRRLVAWWFRWQLGALRNGLTGRGNREVQYVLPELRGGVVGLLGEYGRSVRRANAVRLAHAPGAGGSSMSAPPPVSGQRVGVATMQESGGRAKPALTVVIPTIGRIELLRACLTSVIRCESPPDQILVVDQSHGGAVATLVAELADLAHAAGSDLVVITDPGRGIARATNLGIRSSGDDAVAVTHDDCTVDPDWTRQARHFALTNPGGIATGRVLPPAGARYVPSTIVSERPKDYTGTVTSGVLYPANMVVSRDAVLEIGGFDERPGLTLAAEDNDFCFRWLAAGRVLRYEPALVVWHHDWRTETEMIRTHVVYAHAQGVFYAKHLYARDPRILRLIAWDLRHGLRSVVFGSLRRTPRWEDPYREMVGSLLVGIARGVPEARRFDRRRHRSSVHS